MFQMYKQVFVIPSPYRRGLGWGEYPQGKNDFLIYVKFFSNSNDNFTCLIYDCTCKEGKGVWASD